MVLLEVRFRVEPLQIGVLLPAVGTAGALGSDKVIGPTSVEVQPFTVTCMEL